MLTWPFFSAIKLLPTLPFFAAAKLLLTWPFFAAEKLLPTLPFFTVAANLTVFCCRKIAANFTVFCCSKISANFTDLSMRPNYFISMGYLRKNEMKSAKQNPRPLYTYEPTFQKCWIRPWKSSFYRGGDISLMNINQFNVYYRPTYLQNILRTSTSIPENSLLPLLSKWIFCALKLLKHRNARSWRFWPGQSAPPTGNHQPEIRAK